MFGSERKRRAKTWIKVLVWSSYLGSLWCAESALDNISNNIQGYKSLMRFWPPFFLVLLGSPDTITAYAIEDNSLWLRLLLDFIVDVGGTTYVFIVTWSNNKITYLAAAMYVVGIIKYGERAYVRHNSSFENFKRTLLSKPDPFPDLIKIERQDIEKMYQEMRDIQPGESDEESEDRDFKGEGSAEESKNEFIEQEGLAESSVKRDNEQEELVEEPENKDVEQGGLEEESENSEIEQEEFAKSDLFIAAFFMFKRFAHLFAGLMLDNSEVNLSIRIFKRNNAKDAFNLVAVELGIMYDVLYTKATIAYSRVGILLRCISVFISISVFLIFFIVIDFDQYTQSDNDIVITCTLLFMNVVIEGFGVILLFHSDWAAIIRLTKFKNYAKPNVHFRERKRWSGDLGQINLTSSCLKEVLASHNGFHKLYSITKQLRISQYKTWENVSAVDDLLKIVFIELFMKSKFLGIRMDVRRDRHYFYLLKEILAPRGDFVLQERYSLDDFLWCTLNLDFDHSLLIWHIATDICYYYDFDTHEGASNLHPTCKVSKCLSDYMLYLLVLCPSMMPKGIGELRFAETFANAKKIFQSREYSEPISRREACRMLVAFTDSSEAEDMSSEAEDMSVLKEGCKLAMNLQELESKPDWGREKKWRMISEVWVEMLTYAASDCEWIQHGYRLAKGGELLTHVSVLMAHLGLSEHYHEKGTKID